MKILHLFPNEKFTVDFVTRINQLFPPSEHEFLIHYNRLNICKKEDLPFSNVFWGEPDEDKERFQTMFEEADRVVLHSLFFGSFGALSQVWHMMKKTKKKVIWAVWGGDLYNFYQQYHHSKNPKHILKEHIRKNIIKNLYGAISEDDYAELIKMYQTNAKQFIATYSYQFIEVQPYQRTDDLINIMIGHSATPTCRHIEALEKLAGYKDKIQIYCPLSYPKDAEAYLQEVKSCGEKLFGNHFHAMTDFMAYPDYVRFLNQIDIGIFNNDRQQGNGNITNLLYLGKKLYMSPENNLLNTYRRIGAFIQEYSEIDSSDFLTPYSQETIQKNRQVILDRYSDETFHKNWLQVFTG